MKYVAYYRVSTQKQGVSGLGLEAQKQVVTNFVKPENIYKEFTEIESGRKSDKLRPVLKQALQLCKQEGATLVIAKLDRLARNVAFISYLIESKVKFTAVDMPEANELTIHILSAIAQNEAKLISERTKSALQIKKQQGCILGTNNLTSDGRAKAIETNKKKAIENENNQRAKAFIKLLDGSLYYKANELNKNGFRTSKGGLFKPTQVKRLIDQTNG